MSNGEECLGQGVPNRAICGEFWLGDEVFGACDHGMRCRDGSRGLGIFWKCFCECCGLDKMRLGNINCRGLHLG